MAKKKSDIVICAVDKEDIRKTIQLIEQKIDRDREIEVERCGSNQISSPAAAELTKASELVRMWKRQLGNK